MYVNKWTLGYGDRGKRAVTELIARGTGGRFAARPRSRGISERRIRNEGPAPIPRLRAKKRELFLFGEDGIGQAGFAKEAGGFFGRCGV